MKHLLITIMSVSLAFLVCAEDKVTPAKPENSTPGAEKSGEPKPGGATKPETTAHEGVGKPIAAVLGGMKLPPADLKAITLKITGGNYEVTVEGEKESDKGTCTLDTSTSPKRMTIKSTEGKNRGKTFLAIYEMKDALRVCYDLSGQEFPKEFEAPKGTQLYLVGYRRPKE